jgi:hypothetical protein
MEWGWWVHVWWKAGDHRAHSEAKPEEAQEDGQKAPGKIGQA